MTGRGRVARRAMALAVGLLALGAPVVHAADLPMPLVLEVSAASGPGDILLRGVATDEPFVAP